jgi:hypothetical protein
VAQQGDQILPGRHVQRVISCIAGDGGAQQRYPAGVEGCQGLLELE